MNATLKRPATTTRITSRNVLILEDDTLVGMGLKAQLEKLGHHVAGQAANAFEAHKLFREHHPNLLLVDIRLEDADGLTLVTELLKERRVPAIVVSAYSDRDLVQRVGEAPVFGYLVKPVSTESLAAQIEVAIRRFTEHEQLAQENAALGQTLAERKLVARAKGLLMRHLKLDEPGAHKRLQQESQKRRIPMAELAKRLIESEELLGGGEIA
jgi:AmiR/NasT family two-component response regulator